ncbi:hypothetical protein [Tamilnaduibacter salinus]|uniref:hypothetical protein n=1 Tax=Tamilnaduibacter salinus TaxID=1484056 RepID=UPI00117CBC2E|nr:hypothetical protein [Tamilnaduibacter salinus]
MALACSLLSGGVSAEILFEESFDDQSDWTSGLPINNTGAFPVNGEGPDRVQCVESGHVLPEGWDCARQDPSWAPSVGDPDRHENLEILDGNASKARGSSGKSLVIWRDSTTGPKYRWNSDGILSKKLLDGHQELYVRFWIKFSKDWTPLGDSGQTKLFRITSWDGPGTNLYGFGGNRDNAPAIFWQYKTDNYGARNVLGFRGDPQETNYKMKKPSLPNTPRAFTSGSMSLNFDDNIRDLDGDGNIDNSIDTLVDLKSEAPVSGGIVPHENFWGTKWHKVEFYVKMNSAPGKLDGVMVQWIDNDIVLKQYGTLDGNGESWR